MGSLAGHLATLTTDAVTVLLERRPDTRDAPSPRTFDELANRLSSEGSLGHVLPLLDADAHAVGCAVVALGKSASPAAVADLLGAPRPLVDRAVGVLLDHGVAWTDVGRIRLPERLTQHWRMDLGGDRAIRKLANQAQAADVLVAAEGLGLDLGARTTKTRATDALHEAMTDRPAMIARLGALPARLRDWLGVGVQGGLHAVSPQALTELTERGLIIRSAFHLQVPREVAIASWLGRARLTGPPELPAASSDPRESESARAAAGEWLRLVVTVLDDATTSPIVTLRSGGVGKRERARLAKRYGLPEDDTVALLVDLTFAAGLLGVGADEYAPTAAYATWRDEGAAARWTTLALAWWRLAHAPARRVGIDGKEVPPPLPLPSLDGHLRRALLSAAAPDRSVDAARRNLVWHCPVGPDEDVAQAASPVVGEASTLGVVVGDALSDLGAALVAAAGDEEALGRAAAGLLADPECEVVLQSDLTALVSGRPSASTARLLADAADTETRGSASVYRFSPATVRRALDRGWDADGLVDALRALSSRELPQPLEYLVGDVARRHGEVRVRAATTVLVTTEALARELLRTRSLKDLGLAAVAPTVLVSGAARATVLEKVRKAGHFPVAEDPSGAVIVEKTGPRRGAVRAALTRERASAADLAVTLTASRGAG